MHSVHSVNVCVRTQIFTSHLQKKNCNKESNENLKKKKREKNSFKNKKRLSNVTCNAQQYGLRIFDSSSEIVHLFYW